MRKIVVYAQTGYACSLVEEIVEIEDNATEEEIKNIVNEVIFESLIECGYYEKEEED